MSNPFDDPDGWSEGRSTKRKVTIVGLVAIVIIATLTVGPYAYFYFKSAESGSCGSNTATVNGFGVVASTCVKMGVAITYQQDLFPRLSMLEQGYSPSCWVLCVHGITYTLPA